MVQFIFKACSTGPVDRHGKGEAVADEILGLKAWQQRRLMTIRSLAAAAKVSPVTVVQIEAGRRQPRPGTIRALSAALGVAPEQVIEFRAAMGYQTSEEKSDEG